MSWAGVVNSLGQAGSAGNGIVPEVGLVSRASVERDYFWDEPPERHERVGRGGYSESRIAMTSHQPF